MQDIRRNFFTQLYRDLYGDAMLVPHPDGQQMMVARNQQKHLSLGFAAKA